MLANKHDLSSFMPTALSFWVIIPLAFLLGIKLPTMMHNAVHGNFKRYNYLIGELTSQVILGASEL